MNVGRSWPGNASARSRLVLTERRPRGPGWAFTVLTAALAVLIGTLALTSRETAPPTIAEFAPQAAQQIAESDEASAGRGGSGGSLQEGHLDPVTRLPTSGAAIDVARVRRCVGDPPRQIEDPQSPPCVPYWSGDNGGETSRGVTRDEIRIVVTEYNSEMHPALESFFNSRFEFYGRQLRLMRPSQGPAGGDAAAERAAARAVYEQDKAFASNGGNGGNYDYYDELARLGIVAIGQGALFPQSYLAAHRPYMWQYAMANDRMFALTGSWYCARFSGRPAVHAGDPLLRSARRELGVILTNARDGTSAEPLGAQLASCDDAISEIAQTSDMSDSIDPATDVPFIENAVLQMKTSGVTTLACLCGVIDLGSIMRAATNQSYFPEWLVTSFIWLDNGGAVRALSNQPEQIDNMMGLTMMPMDRPPEDHPSNWAISEQTGTQAAPSSFSQWVIDDEYHSLLLLASGIQMAGPNLTAASLERGLHRARFPNPPHSTMPGAVGFSDADHSMTEDAAEMWWSNSGRNPYGASDGLGTGQGAYCYVDHGARRGLGGFPHGDEVFFGGDCDSGI